MPKIESYLYYEAGQAVAAAHLKLAITHVSANPAVMATQIAVPRGDARTRMTLWLTGMAAERKGVGKRNPLRHTRNRLRIRALIEAAAAEQSGSATKRMAKARVLFAQAQDHANAICVGLEKAIGQVAGLLEKKELVTGEEVVAVVKAVKQKARKAKRRK